MPECEECPGLWVDPVAWDEHRDWHESGPKMFSTQRLEKLETGNGVEMWVIPHDAGAEDIQAFRKCLMHTTRRDYTTNPHPYKGALEFEELEFTGFVASNEGRVTALMSAFRSKDYMECKWAIGATPEDDWPFECGDLRKGRRWCIRYIWVREPERDHGLAYELLDAACDHLGIKPQEMAWQPWFSPDAKKMMARLSGQQSVTIVPE